MNENKKINEDEEMYEITPKGIFSLALCETHLVESVTDCRIDATWKIFELMMEYNGYIAEEDEEEKN